MSDVNDDFLNNVVNAPAVVTIADPFDDAPVKTDASVDAVLTADEKQKAIDAWNGGVSDLKTLITTACGPGFDGRSKKGMAIKKFLADQNMKARPAQVYLKKTGQIELTEDNKEFIAMNASSMKPLEITKLVFDDGMLTPLSAEFRVVKAYYDSLDLKVKAQSEDENVKDYNPPKTETQALSRINRYVFEAIDVTKVTPRHRECISKLIRFMHTHRYLFEINNLPLTSERELFESSFVRFVHDKPDLTEEEIDLYLNQCSDIVSYQRMQKELVFLNEAAKTTMEVDQKVPMALVEAVGKLRGDMNDNFKRQKATLNDLNGKRANRLDKLNTNSDTVLKLVEAFRSEEGRHLVAQMAELRKQELVNEVKRLETMDDLKFQLWGLSAREAI